MDLFWLKKFEKLNLIIRESHLLFLSSSLYLLHHHSIPLNSAQIAHCNSAALNCPFAFQIFSFPFLFSISFLAFQFIPYQSIPNSKSLLPSLVSRQPNPFVSANFDLIRVLIPGMLQNSSSYFIYVIISNQMSYIYMCIFVHSIGFKCYRVIWWIGIIDSMYCCLYFLCPSVLVLYWSPSMVILTKYGILPIVYFDFVILCSMLGCPENWGRTLLCVWLPRKLRENFALCFLTLCKCKYLSFIG